MSAAIVNIDTARRQCEPDTPGPSPKPDHRALIADIRATLQNTATKAPAAERTNPAGTIRNPEPWRNHQPPAPKPKVKSCPQCQLPVRDGQTVLRVGTKWMHAYCAPEAEAAS